MKVSVQNLSKSYGAVKAVNGVSFDVMEGAVTGFVGVNGSGKTTTIKMMLELIRSDSGETFFGDHRYRDLPQPRRAVGAVVDRLGAHPRHSARQHLGMIADSAGIPRERIDAVLEEVHLLDVADKAVGQFSLGMTQRCALGAALLGEPEVLILDEPATGLDPSGIRWLREQLRSYADDGRTVLVSTHHLAELSNVADQVVVLNEGRTVFAGGATELRGEQSLEDAIFSLMEFHGTERDIS